MAEVTDEDLVNATYDLATKIYVGRDDACVWLTPEQARRLAELARARLAERQTQLT